MTELRLDDGARMRVPPNWSLTDHDAEQLLHTAAAESGLGASSARRATRSTSRACTAGGVGTGFNTETRRSLRAALEDIRREPTPLDDPAPASVRRAAWWVEPVLVVDVEYREVSGDGLLRHPSFRGIRTDKIAGEVGLPGQPDG
ncbi:hypothetical protein [Nocardia asteroides]|uniref:ATP dependent DNA ligase n=1 Tax=Nocardia asteroides TaxID=1824 RepID=UPI0033D75BB8